ncbi:hypothetical protein BU24DRAFT_106494 [Aaosphaeria arxii CBS 175.79]|uniref:Uncharacterized protein n=1 Tax=Aaosphaeria arxii CBS 175.79 TaxID=1450172 RepID=A0A6A5Y068_9PLEO|nr:uncharacterized protein BU24DRAFT_106494 [Aaosphaeria arxii CBS 175.79]KAF2018852.1 hypothetical protein BU24DRAFT_106494 [Aaosphaeria arxii CBS 175.79]
MSGSKLMARLDDADPMGLDSLEVEFYEHVSHDMRRARSEKGLASVHESTELEPKTAVPCTNVRSLHLLFGGAPFQISCLTRLPFIIDNSHHPESTKLHVDLPSFRAITFPYPYHRALTTPRPVASSFISTRVPRILPSIGCGNLQLCCFPEP